MTTHELANILLTLPNVEVMIPNDKGELNGFTIEPVTPDCDNDEPIGYIIVGID